jgi:hypothetical protein
MLLPEPESNLKGTFGMASKFEKKQKRRCRYSQTPFPEYN